MVPVEHQLFFWKPEKIKHLLLFSSISTFILVLLGYLVRVTNSTYGCPDWPTCYGQFGLPAGTYAQIQYAHRIVAIIATLMVFISTGIVLTYHRRKYFLSVPLIASSLLLVFEILLGAEAIHLPETSVFVLMHQAMALIILALTIFATLAAFASDPTYQFPITLQFQSNFAKLTVAAFAGVLALMVNGAYIVTSYTDQACSNWPFCYSGVIPLTSQDWGQFIHGLLALMTTTLLVILFLQSWRTYRSNKLILTSTTAIGLLFLGQIFIGYMKVTKGYPAELVGVHATTTAALWAAMCVLFAGAGFMGRDRDKLPDPVENVSKTGERLKDYIMLTKPFIVILLLVTTLAGMIIGGQRLPPLQILIWTLIAGAFAAGGSSAINQYIDRDIDRRMQRTARRPVASGRLFPAEGLAFGVGLCIVAFFLFVGFINLLAALLALAGMVYYVLIYSIFLKKTTVQNIVVGGGAGALPPLVGWAAATNSLNIPSLMLFAVIFFWTPPHFWALALVRVKDYARAGIPMLPVVKGDHQTRIQIFIYTLELVALTLLLPLFKMVGSLYLISAVALGGLLIYFAWKVLANGGNKTAWNMYRYSSIYLALLFFAMVLDVLLKKPG